MIQIQLRRGTTAEWAAADPILAEGEIGIDLTVGDFKIGDGVNIWSDLDFQITEIGAVPIRRCIGIL